MFAPGSGLQRFCQQYCQERLNLSQGAAQQLAVAVREYGRWLGHEPRLEDLNLQQVLGFLRALIPVRAPATCNSKRRALMTLWRSAAAQGLVQPPPPIPKLLEPQRIPTAWRLEEFSRLLATARGLSGTWCGVPQGLAWEIALLVAWDTAVRRATLLAAKLEDVDLTAGTWYVPAEHLKGRRRDRVFRLHPETLAAIGRSLGNGRTSNKLFPFPFRRRALAYHFRRLLKLAGLPADRYHQFHCIRRSAESWAAAAISARGGDGIGWAAAAVGHSEAIARARYISPLIYQPPALVDALPRPTF